MSDFLTGLKDLLDFRQIPADFRSRNREISCDTEDSILGLESRLHQFGHQIDVVERSDPERDTAGGGSGGVSCCSHAPIAGDAPPTELP